MNDDNQKGKNGFKKRILTSLNTGFFAGIIWGLFLLLAYYLQFTDVGPSVYAKPVLNPEYVLKWKGHLIGIGFFIIYTIIFSLIYGIFLVRFKTPIAGIIYGLVLWAFVFYVLNPLFDMTKSVKELGLNTNSVMLSLYILTGLFIGYTLSVEYNNADKSN